MASDYVHANALSVNGTGVLVRGASKAGKSTLTLALIRAARERGLQAALVGDDRIALHVQHGKLMASGHPRIHGKIEVRGTGILDVPFEPGCTIGLVVDLLPGNLACSGESNHINLKGFWLPLVNCAAHSDLASIVARVLDIVNKV